MRWKEGEKRERWKRLPHRFDRKFGIIGWRASFFVVDEPNEFPSAPSSGSGKDATENRQPAQQLETRGRREEGRELGCDSPKPGGLTLGRLTEPVDKGNERKRRWDGEVGDN